MPLSLSLVLCEESWYCPSLTFVLCEEYPSQLSNCLSLTIVLYCEFSFAKMPTTRHSAPTSPDNTPVTMPAVIALFASQCAEQMAEND